LRSTSLGFAPSLLESKTCPKNCAYDRTSKSIVHQVAEQGLCRLYRVQSCHTQSFSFRSMYGRNAGGQGISLISNDGHPPAKMVPIEPIKTQPQVFPFLELPAEIRNMIYSYLMIPKYPVYVYVRRFQSAVSTGLLFANRQIYQEASTAFYSNARGIVINECHFLTRASCRRVFFKDPPPVHAYSEHPFLPLPHSSHHNSREERHHSNLQAYRHPSLRYTQPCVLAVMAEIEISLAWLPRSDNTEMAIESIMYEVAAMLHCTLKLLRQTGDQKGKRIILIFGDLL